MWPRAMCRGRTVPLNAAKHGSTARVVLAVAVFVVLESFGVADVPKCSVHIPRRIVWRGTITNGSLPGTFVARTHLIIGGMVDTQYSGHFRCRGPGCPAPRARIDFRPPQILTPPVIHDISFDGAASVACFYSTTDPPPDFAVNGGYTCDMVAYPPPVHPVVAAGTLTLVPSRFPCE